MAGTYALTSTPQQVATGSTVQTFTNTGGNAATLTWGSGQSTIVYPGSGVDPRSVARFVPGGPVMASSSGTTLVVADVVTDQGIPGVGGTAYDDLSQDVLDRLNATYATILTPPTGLTYNADGSVATQTVAGVTTSYTYNADGTVATEVRAGVTRTYTYNADGTLASVA